MVASSAGLAHVAAVGESQTVAILAGRRTWRRVNQNRITDSWIEQLQLRQLNGKAVHSCIPAI